MEFVTAWRILARARWPVLAGALVAMAVGLTVAGVLPLGGGGRGVATHGLAHGRVLIDTRSSLIADVNASADAIGEEAALLADLLAADPEVRAIARAAALPPNSLVVLRPADTAATVPSPLAQATSLVAAAPATYTLTVDVATDLPIVTLDAVAPTREAAHRLDVAAASALSALAVARAPDPSRALAVRSFEPVRTVTVTSGGGAKLMLVALIAAVVVFALWCFAIVASAGFLRVWRNIPDGYDAAT